MGKGQFSPSIIGNSHTVKQIEADAAWLVRAFTAYYRELAQAMFSWSSDSGVCDAMFDASWNQAPERFLIDGSNVAMVVHAGQVHMLPIVESGFSNIYGYPSTWRINPNGDTLIADELRKRKFDHSNSAIICNSSYEIFESVVIEQNVIRMVDSIITLYQRTLLSRSPFVIGVEDMNDTNVNTFVEGLLKFAPAILKYGKGSMMKPEVMNLGIALDPALLDVISYWESIILTFIGYDCTDAHKRAQMSVPEILTSKSKILARRHDKLRCREFACNRFNKIFGTDIKVVCNIDEDKEEEMEYGMDRGPDLSKLSEKFRPNVRQ